jgi:hypothetical protein
VSRVSAAKTVGGVWEAKETMRGAGALDKAVPCCSALLGAFTCKGAGSIQPRRASQGGAKMIVGSPAPRILRRAEERAVMLQKELEAELACSPKTDPATMRVRSSR